MLISLVYILAWSMLLAIGAIVADYIIPALIKNKGEK